MMAKKQRYMTLLVTSKKHEYESSCKNMVKQPQAQSPQRVIRDIQLLRAQKSKVYQKRNLLPKW